MKTLLLHLVLLTAMFTIVSARKSDSLITIRSFYSPHEFIYGTQFATSVNGDTALLIYPLRLNVTDTSETDSIFLRVRSWNTKTAATLQTLTFTAYQKYKAKALFNIVMIDSIPRFVFPAEPNILEIRNAYNGSALHRFVFPYSITSLSYSPDNSFSFITTDSSHYYIVNNKNGSIVLNDSIPDRFTAQWHYYYKFRSQTENWTFDNKVMLINVYEYKEGYKDTLTNIPDVFGTWKPYNIDSNSYSSKTFVQNSFTGGVGVWNRNAKRFINLNQNTITLTDLNGKQSTLSFGVGIKGYEFVYGTTNLVTIDFTGNVTIWDYLTKSKVQEFSPGLINRFSFNQDATHLAYITDDDTLRVINTKTLKGIYTQHIPFPNAIQSYDKSSFIWGSGNRVVFIRDNNKQYKAFNLTTGKTIVTFDSTDVWSVSADGTTLFIIRDKITRYDLFDGKIVSEFPEHELYTVPTSISFNPDGSKILTSDSTLRIWDTQTGLSIKSKPLTNTSTVVWTPDSTKILLLQQIGNQKRALVVNSQTLDSVYSITKKNSLLYHGFSTKGKYLLLTQDTTLFVVDVTTGITIKSVTNKLNISTASYNELNHIITLGDISGTIRAISDTNNFTLFQINVSSPIRKVITNQTGKYLAYSSEKTSTIIRINDKKKVQELSTPAYDIIFNNSDSLFVAIYEDSIIEFFLSNGNSKQYFTTSHSYFQPTYSYSVVAGRSINDSITLTQYQTHLITRSIPNVASRKPIRWNSTGTTLAINDMFNNIIIWKPENIVDTTSHTTDVENEANTGDSPQFVCSPNPATSFIKISLLQESNTTNTVARIYNQIGDEVLKMPINQTQVIPTDSLPSGYYTIQVTKANKVYIEKLIILH